MKFLFKATSTITDQSTKINNYKTGDFTFSYTTADAIYIGSELPFNHFYVKLGSTPNVLAATLAVKTYKYDEFKSVVEIVDETIGLTQDGYVSFVPDRNEAWERRSTNDGRIEITELNTVNIYDLYWLKLTYNTSLTASTKIAWIGQLFNNDADLFAEYPEFNQSNMLTAFESGKTNWQEQSVTAASLIIKDLQAKNIIINKGQVLDKEVFKLASVSKTAQIIYNSFGKDYIDRTLAAKAEYESRMDIAVTRVDTNKNGILDDSEKGMVQGWLSR